jgi:hypothetical protein
VAPLHQVEHALALADARASHEEEADPYTSAREPWSVVRGAKASSTTGFTRR